MPSEAMLANTALTVWTTCGARPSPGDRSRPAISLNFLPQDDPLNGTLVKLPAGFTGKMRSHGSSLRAVVIQGQPQYQVPNEADVKTLEPGSYFSSKGKSVHHISSEAGGESIIYVRMEDKFDVIAAQLEK